MDQKVMLGNEAVARGLYEASCRVVSSYPGTPSTEITEEAAKYDEIYCEWAPNEKVGMEVAFGASLAGARSCCCMKHVGLNVAADPLFTLSYTGVNGGLVICVADDPGMHSSQNEQDSRHYAIGAKLPMLEPSDSKEAKEFTKLAFELSEEYDCPVILRMCTRIAHSQYLVDLEERKDVALKEYVKDPQKYIMTPANAIKKHPEVEKRMKALEEYANSSSINKMDDGEDKYFGIITSGTSYQYVKEVFKDTHPVLKLGMVNPLPESLIKDFASGVKKLIIVEELDPVIENYCKQIGLECEGKSLFPTTGEFSQAIIAKALGMPELEQCSLQQVPVRPPVMCPGCPHRGLFYVLSKLKLTVLGDIGCYTLGSAQPLNAMDSTLCMGASVSGLHGFNKANPDATKNSVCVIGDSTFMHSGMTGLANIAYNNTNSTVIILDNSTTGMTGHQQNPTTGFNIKNEPATKINLEALCNALGIEDVVVVDPYDLKACEETVKEHIQKEVPSVIISRRPCVLLKNVKLNKPLSVDEDKCRTCRSCMKIGCPAISIKNDKAVIDQTLCTGCGVCMELCAFDAI